MACLFAIELLGWPLDRIVHAEVWATDTVPADLPPMVEFKKRADEIIEKRFGIAVEHVCAMKPQRERERERERDYLMRMFSIGNIQEENIRARFMGFL